MNYIFTFTNVASINIEKRLFSFIIQLQTNSFQMVLATDEVYTYAIFNYINLLWSSHTEAGGKNKAGSLSLWKMAICLCKIDWQPPLILSGQ